MTREVDERGFGMHSSDPAKRTDAIDAELRDALRQVPTAEDLAVAVRHFRERHGNNLAVAQKAGLEHVLDNPDMAKLRVAHPSFVQAYEERIRAGIAVRQKYDDRMAEIRAMKTMDVGIRRGSDKSRSQPETISLIPSGTSTPSLGPSEPPARPVREWKSERELRDMVKTAKNEALATYAREMLELQEREAAEDAAREG